MPQLQLAEAFDLAWASAWGQTANKLICPLFGLPPLPVVPLPPTPFEPREKVAPIAAFTHARPTAWVDVDPSIGLTYEIVEQLLAWQPELS
jgi:hypothetical protein